MHEVKVSAPRHARQEKVRRVVAEFTSDLAEEAQSDDLDGEELTEAFIPLAGLVGLLLVIIVGAVVVFALAALQNL